MAGPYVTGSSSGFPQTAANRTRAQASEELSQYVGGETRADVLTRAGQCWDAAVRAFNGVPWKFNRVTQDLLLDSSMLDNTTPPSVSRDAGAGVGFTLSTSSTIRYWIEERVKSGDTVLKRNIAPAASVVTLTGDGTADKPVITRPATVNADTTHWALFATGANGVFPNGAQVSEVAIATTTIEDTRTGNNPAIPSGTLYEPGSFPLQTDFRNAKRGILCDVDGLEKYEIQFKKWDEAPSIFSINDSASSSPVVYTVRNSHATGLVYFWPRLRPPISYPIFRLHYHKWIALAVGQSDVLDVPRHVDEAIFQHAIAIIVSRLRSFEQAREAFVIAANARLDVEQTDRDWEDF